MDFIKVMSEKDDQELVNIVYIDAFNYTEDALFAAKNELKNRMNDELKASIKDIIEKKFEDLASRTDSDLLDYSLDLHRTQKKSVKEVKHILNMSNIKGERFNLISKDFENIVSSENAEKSSRKKLIGAVMFFGGIVFTVMSISSAAETSGAYYVAYGAVIWGFLYMFEFI